MHLFVHTHSQACTHEGYMITVQVYSAPCFQFRQLLQLQALFSELSKQTVYCAIGTMTLPSHWSGLSAQSWEPLCSLSSACAIWIRVGCHQTLNKIDSHHHNV